MSQAIAMARHISSPVKRPVGSPGDPTPLPPSAGVRFIDRDEDEDEGLAANEDEDEDEGMAANEGKALAGSPSPSSRQKKPAATTPTWIVKPESASQGDGIFIIQSSRNLPHGSKSKLYVVQRYLADPLLLPDGRKFDVRLYVLVTGVSPNLRAYVCREGIVRACTEEYVAPASGNLHHLHAHLTNYSINKRSSDFVHNGDAEDGSTGSKRSLGPVLAMLRESGALACSISEFWNGVDVLAARTLCG